MKKFLKNCGKFFIDMDIDQLMMMARINNL